MRLGDSIDKCLFEGVDDLIEKIRRIYKIGIRSFSDMSTDRNEAMKTFFLNSLDSFDKYCLKQFKEIGYQSKSVVFLIY